MLTYVGYLVCLSLFIIITYPGKLDSQTGCPVKSTDDNPAAVNSTRQVCCQALSMMLFYYWGTSVMNEGMDELSKQFK